MARTRQRARNVPSRSRIPDHHPTVLRCLSFSFAYPLVGERCGRRYEVSNFQPARSCRMNSDQERTLSVRRSK